MSPLGPPPDDLGGFPAHTLAPGRTLHRIHGADRGPWWFGGSLAGRFDLGGERGTCYTADDPLGAFLEVFRDTATVAQQDVERRRLSLLSAARALQLADCTDPACRRWGVTGAIHSSPEYGLTQRWARRFDDAGFDGVRHLVSHDPGQNLVGIALFGPRGEPAGTGAWQVDSTGPVPDEVLRQAAGRCGILVLPTP